LYNISHRSFFYINFLTKIFQEECNKSGSEDDEDGDEGDISDNVSTTVAEPADDLSEFRTNLTELSDFRTNENDLNELSDFRANNVVLVSIL
jgi:hypothetical protein